MKLLPLQQIYGIILRTRGGNLMSKNNLPPKIQGLLKKRSQPWPPDETLKKQMQEVAEKAAGSLHTAPEILKKVLKESGRFPEV